MNIHKFEAAGLGKAPFRVVGFSVRKYQACYGAPIQPGASCDYCGTGIMNVYTIASSDERRFVVGCDCVAKTGDAGLRKQVRDAVRAHRDEASIARRKALETVRQSEASAWLTARPELAEALTCDHEIVREIAGRLNRFGSLSQGQIDLVLKLHAEHTHGVIGPVEPPIVSAPVTADRIVIEGVIVATKTVESQYGSQLKMLLKVRTPVGYWKAWSTVPRSLERPQDGLRGHRVVIKARVERSKDDPTFAFLSRPVVAA